jgi:hypothetical protein
MSTRGVAMLVVAAVIATSGCGIPNDSRPRAIAQNDRSLSIGEAQPPSAADAPTGSPVIFLVDQTTSTLVAVRRPVPADARSVLDALLLKPTKDDLAANRTTAIPSGVTVIDVSRSAPTIITVDLRVSLDSPGFEAAQGVLGVAQLVFTLTSLRCVRGVRFTINGVPKALSDENGKTQSRPLERADFAGKQPPFTAVDSRRPTDSCG